MQVQDFKRLVEAQTGIDRFEQAYIYHGSLVFTGSNTAKLGELEIPDGAELLLSRMPMG